MKAATIQGFFNPQYQGDGFKGLNSSIEGKVADRIITGLPEFLREAGRDYWIRKVPSRVTDPFGGMDDNGPCPMDRDVEGQFHLIRSNDGKVVSPHTVTGQYAPLSLMDIADELKPFTDQGWATPDGVYEGRDGQTEIVTLRLDSGLLGADGKMPDGSTMLHYLVVVNPHGTRKPQGKIIDFRIWCANTFARAVSASFDWTVSHRKGNAESDDIMKGRVSEAIKTWDRARIHVKELSDRIAVWNDVKVDSKLAGNLADRLLGIDGKEDDDISGQARGKRDRIVAAFSNEKIGTFGRSAWDFLNAVTFTTSNGEAKSKVKATERMLRNIEPAGVGFKLEEQALELVEALR